MLEQLFQKEPLLRSRGDDYGLFVDLSDTNEDVMPLLHPVTVEASDPYYLNDSKNNDPLQVTMRGSRRKTMSTRTKNNKSRAKNKPSKKESGTPCGLTQRKKRICQRCSPSSFVNKKSDDTKTDSGGGIWECICVIEDCLDDSVRLILRSESAIFDLEWNGDY